MPFVQESAPVVVQSARDYGSYRGFVHLEKNVLKNRLWRHENLQVFHSNIYQSAFPAPVVKTRLPQFPPPQPHPTVHLQSSGLTWNRMAGESNRVFPTCVR